MSKRKENFTPGPWVFEPDTGFVDQLNDTGEVCEVWIGHRQPTGNGYLIAAAPEMYEALAEAVEKYGQPGGPWNVPAEPGSWIAKARAALKKARGEE